jgi:hypothetical protein
MHRVTPAKPDSLEMTNKRLTIARTPIGEML